jgi:inositol-phosphate phosphatase / L-galactose 1-phosphate phosphatase / histidinol-phosphatase
MTPSDEISRLTDFAAHLADITAPIITTHFRKNIVVEKKDDETPVTIADRGAEKAMREAIMQAFPEHGIIGEEFGAVSPDAEYVWVLDPIDGTKSFVTGKPLFGTLIALAHKGTPIIGVLNAPAVSERWIGVKGRASTHNESPVRTRACAELTSAWMYATSPQMFAGPDLAAFELLRKKVSKTLYGADCYAYGLLAMGQVDLIAEADLKPYDYAALVPIIEGAGGIISDWNGQPVTLHSDGRILAAGDVRSHEAALDVLKD